MAEERDPVDAAADALYALPPGEFIAARGAAAADATGTAAKGIGRLGKPTVAAWAVNLLVRDGQLAEAAELGAALREAQDELDAKDLAELGAQRRKLVASLTRRAAELVKEQGGMLSAPVREAVSTTINAAIMDEAAAAAVLTGRLIKPLEPGDLEGVDLGEIVAGSVPGVPVREAPARNDLAERRARKAAERAARDAEQAASAAERELARIAARQAKAREHADLLHERVETLRAELERVRADAEAADTQLEEVERQHRDAAERAKTAGRDADRARAALTSLDGP